MSAIWIMSPTTEIWSTDQITPVKHVEAPKFEMQSLSRELPHPQKKNELFISRVEYIPSVALPQQGLSLEIQALTSIQEQF